MGKDKKKRKKPTQDDTSDAEISDNGDNITNDTTTHHFPRFLLIESVEENHNITLVWRSKFQIRYAATVARNMDTTKTGVRKTLSVQIVASRQITRNKIVEMLLTVLTVVKNTVLTLKNARFGTEKNKF